MSIRTSYWTRSDVKKFKDSGNTRFPVFEPAELGSLMPGYHVWDSWFVLTEDGKVADFKGHKVLIALVRPLGGSAGERIGVFVETPEGYVARGFLFSKPLFADVREWSGSTILRDDGRLQSFYTVSNGVAYGGVWQTNQRFATAIQKVTYDSAGLPVFNSPDLHVLLCEPDGVVYETPKQAALREKQYPSNHDWVDGNDQSDNFCFRDPKFFKDPVSKHTYLIFEGNTGPGSKDPAGHVRQRYMGDLPLEGYAPTPDDLKANGCVGVFQLTNKSYTFGQFKEPWLVANCVTDEIERINLMYVHGAYYLFVAGHGNKNSMLSVMPQLMNVDYMLGFRAETLFGELHPLNQSGVVVHQRSLGDRYSGQAYNQQYTYSWLLVPTADPTLFQCVSYANYCKGPEGDIVDVMTAGPSLLVHISGLSTTIVDKMYDIVPAPQDVQVQ